MLTFYAIGWLAIQSLLIGVDNAHVFQTLDHVDLVIFQHGLDRQHEIRHIQPMRLFSTSVQRIILVIFEWRSC